MPTFLITGPDGAKYKVTAPDGATEQDILARFQSEVGGKSDTPEVADKYATAASEDIKKMRSAGVPAEGTGRLAAQGMTFNAADEILAGLTTPLEMINQRTFNPVEGYRYAKAKQDALVDEARKNTGYAGTASEVLGGVGSGAGLANAGLTAARMLPQGAGLLPRMGASAIDGLGMGAIAGLMEGNTLDERAGNAAVGGLLGGGVGAAAPAVSMVAKGLLSPLVSNVRARANPTGYAETQVARAATESGMTPQQIAGEVSRAAAEGQPMYTLADALGNPGQRMLSTVTRAPGPGRTEAVNFLEGRQAGQGRRIANTLAEGFDTPITAEQTRAAMTSARDTAADAAYGAARSNASPVDLSRVISRIDDTLQPGVNQVARPQSGIANDSIESALENFRSRMTDGRSVMTDFTAIQRLRGDLSDAVQSARQSGLGNKARMLGQVLGELDTAMENASQGFRQANRNFAQASSNIDAIGEGATAARRGRSEDIVNRYRNLPAQGQEGYRSGYADPYIADAQGAAFGVNKARPLTSDAFATESAEIAPMRTQPAMMRKIARENTMFETRANALGNSKTADNLADAEAMSIDPTIVGQLLSGNVMGAARSMLASGSNLLTGNTAQVREQVGRLLLQSGQNVTPQNIQRVLDEAMKRLERAKANAMLLGRGAQGGLAVGATEMRR